jgi:hypothetical protein
LAGFQVITYGRFWVFTEGAAASHLNDSTLVLLGWWPWAVSARLLQAYCLLPAEAGGMDALFSVVL